MLAYTWEIISLEVNPNLNGLENVITSVNWMFTAVNEAGISGTYPGTNGFPAPDTESYIPYSQLTKETISAWLETVNDMSDLQFKANIAIANKENPAFGTDEFPWDLKQS